jgi:hypothetical protein
MTGDDMDRTDEIRNWKIDPWGLLRGLAMLFSALLAVTALHYLVLAIFGG